MARALVLILAGSILIGCGPAVKFFPMNAPPDYLQTERIDVFSATPDRPFVEVGLIKVKERTSFLSSPEKMMRKLREKAVEVGADAIILHGLSSELEIDFLSLDEDDLLDLSNKDVITATAIAWIDEDNSGQ